MEALRTQLDNLRWEVNRLDVENRRLRAEDQEASKRVDLEAELEETRGDVAGLTERVTAYEKQKGELEATREQLTEANARATRELEETREQLAEANARATRELEATREQLTEANARATRELEETREQLAETNARAEGAADGGEHQRSTCVGDRGYTEGRASGEGDQATRTPRDVSAGKRNARRGSSAGSASCVGRRTQAVGSQRTARG